MDRKHPDDAYAQPPRKIEMMEGVKPHVEPEERHPVTSTTGVKPAPDQAGGLDEVWSQDKVVVDPRLYAELRNKAAKYEESLEKRREVQRQKREELRRLGIRSLPVMVRDRRRAMVKALVDYVEANDLDRVRLSAPGRDGTWRELKEFSVD